MEPRVQVRSRVRVRFRVRIRDLVRVRVRVTIRRLPCDCRLSFVVIVVSGFVFTGPDIYNYGRLLSTGTGNVGLVFCGVCPVYVSYAGRFRPLHDETKPRQDTDKTKTRQRHDEEKTFLLPL
jgi:hypothetical protein